MGFFKKYKRRKTMIVKCKLTQIANGKWQIEPAIKQLEVKYFYLKKKQRKNRNNKRMQQNFRKNM